MPKLDPSTSSTPTLGHSPIGRPRCADAMVPRYRINNAPGGAPVAAGAGATAGGGASGGLTTEQRAIAVARCMSPGEGCRSELRSKAVLALANAASFPFSEGLRDLVQVGLEG